MRRPRAGKASTRLRITVIAYVLSSGLAALAGILLVSRLSIASPSMANAYELQAIAAAVVGGASLFGGRGTVLGTVVGAVLFTTMSNAAVLLGIDPFWEMVLEGLLIALVVYLDNLQKRRQAGVLTGLGAMSEHAIGERTSHAGSGVPGPRGAGARRPAGARAGRRRGAGPGPPHGHLRHGFPHLRRQPPVSAIPPGHGARAVRRGAGGA